MAKEKKYYVVWEGHQRGVFDKWEDCKKQTDGYKNAKYKSFDSREQAQAAFGSSPDRYIQYGKPTKIAATTKKTTKGTIVEDSICVDAACSGNPGDMEYRGVYLDGTELFRIGPLAEGTNNVGEFLGIVHGLAYLQKQNRPNTTVYSDSKIAIGWIAKGKTATKLAQSPRNKKIFDLIDRATKWLSENKYNNPIQKWETEDWGENPADFGRK
jgi:ribonuclease HI